MSFKVIKHGDVWITARESASIQFPGGVEIDYATFQELRSGKAKPEHLFTEDDKGKLVAIVKPSDLK